MEENRYSVSFFKNNNLCSENFTFYTQASTFEELSQKVNKFIKDNFYSKCTVKWEASQVIYCGTVEVERGCLNE